MHAHTQVEPRLDSSVELLQTIKQGRQAGRQACSTDTGSALRGGVTVIGVSFKASASPETMVSKLTAFAGFLFVTSRCSALNYATTN